MNFRIFLFFFNVLTDFLGFIASNNRFMNTLFFPFIFLRWGIMYIIYIFRTIVLTFVTMFITTFRSLYAPAFFG